MTDMRPRYLMILAVMVLVVLPIVFNVLMLAILTKPSAPARNCVSTDAEATIVMQELGLGDA